MNKLLMMAACLIFATASIAQIKKPDESPKSKLEMFTEKSGNMIKKEFIEIATIKGVNFQVLIVTDLTTNNIEAGLRISGTSGETIHTNHVTLLDKDEIDGLIKALDFMIANVLTTVTPDNDVEYKFTSKTGFSATTFVTQGLFSTKRKWVLNLTLDKFYSSSQFTLAAEDASKVKDAIEKAKAKLAAY